MKRMFTASLALPLAFFTACQCDCASPVSQAQAAQSPSGGTPRIFLPGPSLPRPDGGFDQAELWSPPTGSTADRMKLVGTEDPDADTADTTIYRSLWTSPRNEGETYLVCLQHPGASLGSITQWEVFGFDKNNKQVMLGSVGFSQMTPLGLIEVKVDSKILPEEHNNQWLLAVVAVGSHKGAIGDASLDGLSIGNFPEDPFITIELVAWNDFWTELPYGNANLDPRDTRSIAYRQVEPGLSITPAGTLQFNK